MFKKKVDPEKERMRRELENHAIKVQAEHDRKKHQARRLMDKNYVDQQLAIEQQKDQEFQTRQNALIQKNMNEIKRTELHAFRCKECGTFVDMQNLTCPKCGSLYCQWCGSPMDMMNPGICPRCQRPPMFTPAELVVTKVEDLAPEDRFWEELPTCSKCGATVQSDWPDCPICGSKLAGASAAPAMAPGDVKKSSSNPQNNYPPEVTDGDASSSKQRRENKKKKKRGI